MKWFTIFVEWPRRQLTDAELNSTQTNCAGQILAYDGPGELKHMMHLAETLSEAWDHVELFSGKIIGKQVAVWREHRQVPMVCGCRVPSLCTHGFAPLA